MFIHKIGRIFLYNQKIRSDFFLYIHKKNRALFFFIQKVGTIFVHTKSRTDLFVDKQKNGPIFLYKQKNRTEFLYIQKKQTDFFVDTKKLGRLIALSIIFPITIQNTIIMIIELILLDVTKNQTITDTDVPLKYIHLFQT